MRLKMFSAKLLRSHYLEVLTNIPMQNITKDQVYNYLANLVKDKNFDGLGCVFATGRAFIHCPKYLVTETMKYYFDDRCPAMIENEVINSPECKFEVREYDDDNLYPFTEVVPL